MYPPHIMCTCSILKSYIVSHWLTFPYLRFHTLILMHPYPLLYLALPSKSCEFMMIRTRRRTCKFVPPKFSCSSAQILSLKVNWRSSKQTRVPMTIIFPKQCYRHWHLYSKMQHWQWLTVSNCLLERAPHCVSA